MGRFLRDHVIGLLIISAAGSLLATFIAQALPDPAADGTWWRTLLFQPVPAIVSVLYTLILVAALAALARSWQRADRERHESERADILTQLRSSEEELKALREQTEERRLDTVSMATLMEYVAVVLSDPSDSRPNTHEHVCNHVAGLAGEGVPHAAIGAALGGMLKIEAVRPTYRGLELANDWQRKLERFRSQQTR